MNKKSDSTETPTVDKDRLKRRPPHALPKIRSIETLISHDNLWFVGRTLEAWTDQLDWGFTQKEIDPDYLRAVYEGLERQVINDTEGVLVSTYNGINNDHHYLIVSIKSKSSDLCFPLIKPKKLIGGKRGSIVGKKALVQLYEESGDGTLQRLFAWGEIEEVENPKSPKLMIRVLSDPIFAEMHNGLLVEVVEDQILDLADEPRKFAHSSVSIVEW